MKYIVTGSTATQTQMAAAEFVRQGYYPAHLRRMRQQYQRNLEIFTHWVRHYFPCGICVTRPQGGFLMWIELPEAFDSVKLNKELREAKLQIAVGSLFSASGKYRNCLRLSYAQPFTDRTGIALEILGAAVERAMERCGIKVHHPVTSAGEEEGRVSERG